MGIGLKEASGVIVEDNDIIGNAIGLFLYTLENCLHEGKCREVCMVPHVLEMTKLGYADDARIGIGRRLHALRHVCRGLPDQGAHLQHQGAGQAALAKMFRSLRCRTMEPHLRTNMRVEESVA